MESEELKRFNLLYIFFGCLFNDYDIENKAEYNNLVNDFNRFPEVFSLGTGCYIDWDYYEETLFA